MKKMTLICLGAILASQLAGCATIIDGTKQVVTVKTPPTTNATCVLSNGMGQWTIHKTPGKAQVHKSRDALKVKCQKVGYKTNERWISSHMQGAMAGNIIAGGLIGAGIDAEDGSAYAYPSTILVPLKKK